jgi:hypothetical protein
MVTSPLTRTSAALVFLALATPAACTVDVSVREGASPPDSISPPPDGTDPDPVDPPSSPNAYPGKGFIVHEWGTDTVVVGSDGSLQPGLQHEEEDLPAFVYDRVGAGQLNGATSVHVKMETPVTYFYSDVPRTAKVSVAFPSGVLTQWYPAVRSFYPFVAGPNAVVGLSTWADPALDADFPFGTQTCQDKHGQIANGLLDWGPIEILPRDAAITLPEASLEQFTWSHARAVAANPVRIAADPLAGGAPTTTGAPEAERFLFYRGLGNFDTPARVTAAMNEVAVENTHDKPLGALFVVNVGKDKGAFQAFPEGVPAGQTIPAIAPSLAEGALPLEAFTQALGEAVTVALDGAGLYHDESLAMVATWKRQWFKTPGLRVFYLAPQAWTDASIPLTVDPAPDAVTRVMMIRVEVITPDLEGADVEAAKGLASTATEAAARAHFLALGRFAEPRLRRALALLGEPPWGDSFLAEVAAAETRGAIGE